MVQSRLRIPSLIIWVVHGPDVLFMILQSIGVCQKIFIHELHYYCIEKCKQSTPDWLSIIQFNNPERKIAAWQRLTIMKTHYCGYAGNMWNARLLNVNEAVWGLENFSASGGLPSALEMTLLGPQRKNWWLSSYKFIVNSSSTNATKRKLKRARIYFISFHTDAQIKPSKLLGRKTELLKVFTWEQIDQKVSLV